ncbi:histone-lysine N-methyltransferase ASHH2-like isoform X2 [Prosopis cineraria]|uniref:histone-lysine N-methyltransferase ASHH2-like isoform X2 n=1 Tax=Prosopis cineraria TaxID=364024 RepID=UPI00240FD6BE|nr:histone-lysine N-methyltransferase ASHH2-like isoform X2 [Prosopis cineraria]
MGLCERMAMVDEAAGESVIMQHCSEFSLQSVPVERSCSKVGCSVLDSNIELSNILDGCKYFSANEESGSACCVDVTDMPSNARASKYENADMLLVKKTSDNDCHNCCSTFCGQCEVSNLESGSLCSEEKTHNHDDYQLPSEFKSVNGLLKDMKSSTILSTGDTIVAAEEKNNDVGLLTDAGNYIFDFIHSEFSMESEPITGCLVNFDEKSEQEDILRNTDPLEVVDNCNTLCGVKETSCRQISPAQGSEVPSEALYTDALCGMEVVVCNQTSSKDNLPETSTYRTFSSESGLPSFVSLNDNPSKDVPDLLLKDNSCDISYNSNACNSGQNDNGGKQIFRIDRVTGSKCSDIVLLPHRRNSQRNKSVCKQQTGRAPKKCNKQANVPQQEWGVKTISKATRKKRSCFSRAARSSKWGLLGNIKQAVGMDRELNINKVIFEGLRKDRGNYQSGKTNKDSANSSILNSMPGASTTRMRLKIKVGKGFNLYYPNFLVPQAVDGLASISNLGPSSSCQNLVSDTGDKLFDEVVVGKFESDKNNLYKHAVVLNGQVANNKLESAALMEKSDANAEEPCLLAPSKKLVDALVEPVNIERMDPGTGSSPDSEVIDSIPDFQVGERHQKYLNNTDFGSSTEFNFAVHDTASKGRKKKDKVACSCNSSVRDVSPGFPRKNKAKYSKNLESKKSCTDVVSSVELPSSIDMHTLSISSFVGYGEVHTKPLHLYGDIGLRDPTDALEVKSRVEVKTQCCLDINNENSDSPDTEKFLPSERHLGCKIPKSLKSNNVSQTKSKASESNSRKKTAFRHGEKQGRSFTKHGVKGKSVSDKVICEYLHEENDIEDKRKLDFGGKINADGSKVPASVYNLDMVPGVGLRKQHPSPQNAWVRCDDCHKWRCIPASLADLIEETNCAWTCKDSDDKAYADCSIAQEKSNSEINAELGLSDASDEDDNEDCKNYKELEHRRPMFSQESTFTHISANEFLHRSHKTHTIDEIMICHCKPPPKGQLGCGDECLNRMLNIECVQGACSCGDLCSNQQFQKRNYAKLKWFKCGKKGYGLKAIEGISEGQFLVEYVGEVLDMHAYEAQQREYALKGHRHFYFMALNGSEVIDASKKGNLGRFINHSCDPNCRTEKWMVNGEICIGLFALRDIKQDEEVTFDYNYVRVFGAAAKKCYCGSPHCRGYIGGDPLNAEIVVQDDSDEEFPEPVMLTEGDNIEDGLGGCLENSLNPASASSQLHSSIEVDNSKGNLSSSIQVKVPSQQMEDVTSKPMPVLQQGYAVELEHSDKSLIANMETSSSSFFSKSKYEVIEDKRGLLESHLLVKASQIAGSIKKGKACANPSNNLKVGVTKRLQVPSIQHKKAVEGSSNGRFEAVEEKLKELLDANGGIGKSKDATKGYLKLLLLTVASGDRSNGEAIQSNRDLSMILGALLETRSRSVLNDIVNKNGLRMLHNIMKQYRWDFKKIPILRKLLKVLERLAERNILTSEHVNGGPPCCGMESFRESMLSLTEHEDKEVHQIARSFRDRWIPRSVRKRGFINRDDWGVKSYRSFRHNRFSASLNYTCEQSFRPTEAIDCAQLPLVETSSVNAVAQEGCTAPSLNGCEISRPMRRKRKSRWDQPAETNSVVVSSEHKKGEVVSGQPKQADVIINAVDVEQNISKDVPPGFSCSVRPLGSLNASRNSCDLPLQQAGHSGSGCSSDAVIGCPREKFNPCLPVSYGVPWPVIQQYGTPHADIEGSWITAPGMPFYPFPPLPPYRRQSDCQSSKSTDAMKIDQPAEIVKRF